MMPEKAFILAAGYGKRLRPYTDHCPKPMVQVAGRSLIDRTLDHLQKAGVRDVTVNAHYMSDVLIDHLQQRKSPSLRFSREEELLDTGGGIKKALKNFGPEPFFVLSGDGLWENAPGQSTLQQMATAWNAAHMDILILLQPVSSMKLTGGAGDYDIDAQGRARRSADKTGAYMFTSMRINTPEIFKATPDAAFSYLELLDRAEEKGRLYGLVHAGNWHHISTPEDLESVNAAYKAAS